MNRQERLEINRNRLGDRLALKVIQLPEARPRDDPEALWTLQGELLSMAESILGRRDLTKKIYQPRFSDNGPRIRNTPNLDGAFAELSRAGECYWPTVVFEMAHETVHLLNPVPGNANHLEEGVAVAFSLRVQPSYSISIQPSIPSYLHASELASMLPGGSLQAARRVRDRFGALDGITAQHLRELFPSAGGVVLEKLCERFIRNVG